MMLFFFAKKVVLLVVVAPGAVRGLVELSRRSLLTLPVAMAPSAASSSSQENSRRLFEVVPDSSEKLTPRVKEVARLPGGARAVFLGEHHDASLDHSMQAELIRRQTGDACVGFEAVQRKFQPALDAYASGGMGLTELKDAVEWEQRWVWPFERYAPVFEAAKDVGASLLALNVDSEDLETVERGGLRTLPKDVFLQYVGDAAKFSDFAKTPAFREYVRYVVEPSYDAHRRLGILKTTINGKPLDQEMPLSHFFGARMLWDATMAHTAATWCKAHPDGRFLGLVGSDHVKFGCGVPARFAMDLGVSRDQALAVLLNPAPIDTASEILVSRSASLPFVLQLRFDDDESGGDLAFRAKQVARTKQAVLPVADFLWLGDTSTTFKA